jgi:hypothetical protein
MGQWLPDAPELWVMSPSFKTGTTLFDQFRGLPRTHAFDVNACTAIDLLTIDGMTTAAAAAIVAGAPYAAIDEVIQRAGLTGSLAATLERSALSRTGRRAAEIEDAASLSLPAILKPYAWRMLMVLFIASAAAAMAHRSVRRLRWRRAILNGLAGATVGLAAAWMVDPGGALVTIAVPVLLFGCPGGLWRGWRTRSPAEGGRTLAAWALSAAPAALLTLS